MNTRSRRGQVFDPECQGCDVRGPVDEMGLCSICAAKLDRDMIRNRDWDYSVTAFRVKPADREKLRERVIAQYGEKLELIAPG